MLMCIEAVALRIALAGTDEMKSTVLPELLAGRKFAGSATSEPDVGSDPRGIRTRATLEGDRYVLNGTKIWVSAGTLADYLLVMASTGLDDKGHNVITPFLVDVAQSPILTRRHDLIGIRQSHICEVHLDDVSIPRRNMLSGAEGHAHSVLTSTWLSQRPVQALCNVRLAEKAYEAALKYSLERRQFGKPIASFQLVQDMLAEMRTLVDCSKLLCYRSLTLSDTGKRPHLESSMAKLYACQSALRVTNLAVEVHGAFGATRDFAVEKYFRDERVLAFPDGTINIQKLIMGRELTGIRAFS
jgi:acyl-CoA dehydrogenase